MLLDKFVEHRIYTHIKIAN